MYIPLLYNAGKYHPNVWQPVPTVNRETQQSSWETLLLTFALHAACNVSTSEIEVFRVFESSLLFPSLFSILNPSRTKELCSLKLSAVFTPRNVFSFSFFCFLLHHFAASPAVKLKSLFYFAQVFSSIRAKRCAFLFSVHETSPSLLLSNEVYSQTAPHRPRSLFPSQSRKLGLFLCLLFYGNVAPSTIS